MGAGRVASPGLRLSDGLPRSVGPQFGCYRIGPVNFSSFASPFHEGPGDGARFTYAL